MNDSGDDTMFVVILTRTVGEIVSNRYVVVEGQGYMAAQRVAFAANPGWFPKDAMPYRLADGFIEDLEFTLNSDEIDRRAREDK